MRARERRRHRRRIAVLVAATCGLAIVARAQEGPEGGTGAAAPAGGGGGTAPAAPAPAVSDAAPGSLRAQVESVLPGANGPIAGPTTTPAWVVTPGLTVQELWTDNIFQSATDHQSSLITYVSPSVSVTGSTARLQANLYYSPNLQIDIPQSSQDQISHTLGTDALLTLAPDQFYVKASGFASVQSAFAGTGPVSAVALPSAGQVQTYNFSIEPYFTQRFGGWGALQVGASAGETAITSLGSGGGEQSLTSGQLFATFKSGENFGRWSSTVQASSTQNTGTGALVGSSANVASYQVGYALTRDLILLGSIGYEDIRYSGFGAPHYDDMTWSGGVQLIPNPDSSITVTYGHQQGDTNASVNASYAPTARLRLFAQYSAGVTTAAQSLADALAGATFNPQGQPINPITNQPLTPYNNFFGFNGAIYNARSLSVGTSLLWPRDAFQLSFSQQTQTPVGNSGAIVVATTGNLALLTGLAATNGTYGTFSWEHDLNPVLSTVFFAQYGVLHNVAPISLTNGVLTVNIGEQAQQATQLAVSATLNWQINRTLTGSAQYSYSSTDYSGGLPGIASNLVVVGLHKTF